jgi:hypothetical protein
MESMFDLFGKASSMNEDLFKKHPFFNKTHPQGDPTERKFADDKRQSFRDDFYKAPTGQNGPKVFRRGNNENWEDYAPSNGGQEDSRQKQSIKDQVFKPVLPTGFMGNDNNKFKGDDIFDL